VDISSIQSNGTTKEKILHTATMMFAKDGYENVSMRDLADAVGVQASSLYSHFESKREILHALYSAYDAEHQQSRPDMSELLRLAETEPPLEVIGQMYRHNDPGVTDIMDHIIATATHQVSSDPESAEFVKRHLFDIWPVFLKPLLVRMVELGRIEPLDIDTFLFLISIYSFGGTALHTSNMEINRDEWANGYTLLCTLVKPV